MLFDALNYLEALQYRLGDAIAWLLIWAYRILGM